MSDEGRMARFMTRLSSLQDAPNALRLATQSAWLSYAPHWGSAAPVERG